MEAEQRLSWNDCKRAFAVPGSDTLIDVIHPVTGRSACFGETLEQVRGRYPGAQVVDIEGWCEAKAARQDNPVQWVESHRDEYDEMLNALPPAMWRESAFLVGEPWDHHAVSGMPRYQAFVHVDGKYLKSDRPMTKAELRDHLQSRT